MKTKQERIKYAGEVLKELQCNEVIIISRYYKGTEVVIDTYGKTVKACGFAEQVGDQFMKIIKAQPKSLKAALEVIK